MDSYEKLTASQCSSTKSPKALATNKKPFDGQFVTLFRSSRWIWPDLGSSSQLYGVDRMNEILRDPQKLVAVVRDSIP
jgi:hypothetical protein